MGREEITAKTKKAWVDNWKDHGVEEVLQIFEYTRVRRLLKTIVSILPKDGRILEGGCGLGPWVIKLRELGYDVTGVDYDAVSIEKIRSYDNTIPLYVSDVQKMPFEDGRFSAYISLGVLEHFCEGPVRAIREASRVLEAGGIFFVVVPCKNILLRIKYPLEKLKRNRVVRRMFGKEEKTFYYEKYFRVSEIRKLLEDSGFNVERQFPADHIFSFVQFSSIFRDRSTYDGENALAVKCADFFSRIFPRLTAGSTVIIAKNAKGEL